MDHPFSRGNKKDMFDLGFLEEICLFSNSLSRKKLKNMFY